MNINLLHPADQLVMMMNRIYHYGMTTTSGGNLSIPVSYTHLVRLSEISWMVKRERAQTYS